MESKPKYQNGEVTLPVEIYNQMLLKISLFERSLMIKKSWNGETIEVSFNPAVVDILIEESLENSALRHTYNLRPAGEWYAAQSTIGELKPGYTVDDSGKVVPDSK